MEKQIIMLREKQIVKIIHKINHNWFEGNLCEIADYFDEKMAFYCSPTGQFSDGRQNCFDAMNEFLGKFQVIRFDGSNYSMIHHGDTIIASYPFSLEFRKNKLNMKNDGRDMLIFQNQSDRWILIWRAMIFIPADEILLEQSNLPG